LENVAISTHFEESIGVKHRAQSMAQTALRNISSYPMSLLHGDVWLEPLLRRMDSEWQQPLVFIFAHTLTLTEMSQQVPSTVTPACSINLKSADKSIFIYFQFIFCQIPETM
jgi:hypothetical protein